MIWHDDEAPSSDNEKRAYLELGDLAYLFGEIENAEPLG